MRAREGWPHDEDLRNLLLRFFLNFARFEFAMKSGGFGLTRNGTYQPSWAALKRQMQTQPLPDGLKDEHLYLWEFPPNKQTDRDTWTPIQPRDNWPFLIECVKTTRNNLFHGGKIPFRPNRDPELILHCNDVLAALVEHSPRGVAGQFWAAGE